MRYAIRRPTYGTVPRSSFRSGATTDPAFRPWMMAWLGGSILGVMNGVARELLYKERVGPRAADFISTATLIALLALYLSLLQHRWPIRRTSTAYRIGAYWVALTIAFEFGFGHYVDNKSWGELLHNYNVFAGQAWPLVLVWMAIAPAVISRASRPS